MKMLTVHQLRFTTLTAVLTIVFLVARHYSLSEGSGTAVWWSAGMFFIMMLANGWYFGKKDGADLPLAVSALRFHLLTFIVYNVITVIAEGYLLSGIATATKKMILWWGAGLLLHALLFSSTRNKRIDGIKRSDIFS